MEELMSVERGTEANELNMTYTTRGKQRDCLSCNQGGCLYLYILNLYHHTSYTVYTIHPTSHTLHGSEEVKTIQVEHLGGSASKANA